MLNRVGTFANSGQMGFTVGSLQTQLNQAVQEIGSGQKANPEASMGAGAAVLYQLQSQSDWQSALQSSVTTAGQNLSTAQTALTSVASGVQTVLTAAQGIATGDTSGYAPVGSQASSTLNQILGLLNTNSLGSGVFSGDSGNTQPMLASDATGGVTSMVQGMVSKAVSAKGGPLAASDVDQLIDGTNGIASIFNDTNSNPAQRYSGTLYKGSTDGKPTTVVIGTNQTVSYNASANQPAFRDLVQGLSMLSMIGSSSNLDSSGQAELLSRGTAMLAKAQTEVTNLQGNLGAVQSTLTQATNAQKSAASAIQAQILNDTQANTYQLSTQISLLQTQLQATYSLTSQISQLSLVKYMPA
jgi:flagellar hook-associated protein 3 FlgL